MTVTKGVRFTPRYTTGKIGLSYYFGGQGLGVVFTPSYVTGTPGKQFPRFIVSRPGVSSSLSYVTGSLGHTAEFIGFGVIVPGNKIGFAALPSLPGDTGRKMVIGTFVDFYILSPNKVYGETVTMIAAASVPGGVYSCTFDFGDGNAATGEQVTNYYRSKGTYTITMVLISMEAQTFVVTKTLQLYGYRLRFDVAPVSGAIPLTVKFQPVFEADKP